MLSFQIVVNAPFMTLEEYSRYSGMSKRLLRDWEREGKVIFKKREKKTRIEPRKMGYHQNGDPFSWRKPRGGLLTAPQAVRLATNHIAQQGQILHPR